MSGRALVAISVAAALALCGLYLALGGSSYEPSPVADPCEPRQWRSPEGIDEAAEQFALSALDGAACELQVSRETLALGLADEESRRELTARYGLADAEIEAALRAGIVRAIGDAEAAGALPALAAAPLRAVAQRLPVEEAIALIEDARSIFEDARSLLDRLGAIL